MTRQTMKVMTLALVVAGLLMLSVATLNAAQQSKAHPVEGTYDGSANTPDGPAPFVMILKRNGEKWTCELRDTPSPVSVSGTTVDKDNALTITGTVNDAAITIKGKFKDDKIEGTFSIANDAEGTWTATKRKQQ